MNPQSIAVIGGAEAAQVIRQCRKLRFAGEIFAVNPNRDELEGVQCCARIEQLPRAPDAAFIAIPAAASIDAAAALAACGAGGAVCYASGFKETGGDGAALQKKLVRAAGEMPLIGPNCYGFLNLLCGAALWPDYHGAKRAERGAAIFSQSGNVALNLTMQKRHLQIAWLLSLGNQAAFGIEHAFAVALAEPRITAIGLHIEGLRDLRKFAELAAHAKLRRMPVVALKSGRSHAGARIAMSHTATLAGESGLYDAFFARLGIAQVETPEEFIETLKLLSASGAPKGKRIASMSCSGGEAALAADLGGARALEFPPLEDAHRKSVQATLNEYVHAENPLDYHTFIWADRARMHKTFRAMAEGDFDFLLCILDIPGDDDSALEIWMRAVHAFIDACGGTGMRGALVTLLSENMPAQVAKLLAENNIAPLQGLAQALAAVECACAIGMAWARDEPPPSLPRACVQLPARVQLDEHAAKNLLSDVGIETPPCEIATCADDAVRAAEKLGYPVALKALSAGIAHKSEAGALALNVRGEKETRAHFARLQNISARVLVEKMVDDAVAELLLGAGFDAQFGHYFMLGFGGALVELIGDRELLLPPLDETMLRRALAELRTAPLLHGFRGRAHADVGAVVECALRLQKLLHANPRVCEIEINPLMVKCGGRGAVAADAVINYFCAEQT